MRSMITVSGSVKRSFIFPDRRPAAFDYYSQARRILGILPHISITDQYSENAYRLAYQTTELGIYRVRLVCDIQVEPDRKDWVLRIRPLKGKPEVTSQVGVYSLQTQAAYTSDSVFKSARGKTQIDYSLQINAQLPTPFGVRFMPSAVLNGIARSITEWRIEEVAGGFIDRSIQLYQPDNGKVA